MPSPYRHDSWGPCLCGATDCKSCYPGRGGRTGDCWICGDELIDGENLLDLDDEACMACKGWIDCPTCGKLGLHTDDLKRGFNWSDACGCEDEYLYPLNRKGESRAALR